MRKITFIMSVLLAAMAIAAPVTPDKALEAATQFMQQRQAGTTLKANPVSRTPKRMAHGQTAASQSNFYIFNANNNKGYVIVSGDDRTTQILGYSDNGNFDPDNVPVNMQEWLDYYAQQISSLDMLGVTGQNFTTPNPTRNSISPLITSHWDQAGPYWNHCPEFMDIDENGDTVGELAYTGCVATSMAQIMNYYKHPMRCSQLIPSYIVTFYWHEEYGAFETDPPDPIFFDWDNKGDSGPQDGLSDHTGIVEKVENGYVYTVEGNSGDSCRENRYPVGYYEILGYGIPAY